VIDHRAMPCACPVLDVTSTKAQPPLIGQTPSAAVKVATPDRSPCPACSATVTARTSSTRCAGLNSGHCYGRPALNGLSQPGALAPGHNARHHLREGGGHCTARGLSRCRCWALSRRKVVAGVGRYPFGNSARLQQLHLAAETGPLEADLILGIGRANRTVAPFQLGVATGRGSNAGLHARFCSGRRAHADRCDRCCESACDD
jgi:hypothetical protein